MNDNIILEEIKKSFESIDEGKVSELIKIINKRNKIFVYGAGRTGLMLKAFAMRLMQLGYDSYVVGETITPAIEKGDLLLLASASGSTESVVSMARKCSENGIDIYIISSNTESALSVIRKPDILIRSSDKFNQNTNSKQPMSSLFEQMILLVLDYLVYEIFKREKSIGDLQSKHANLE